MEFKHGMPFKEVLNRHIQNEGIWLICDYERDMKSGINNKYMYPCQIKVYGDGYLARWLWGDHEWFQVQMYAWTDRWYTPLSKTYERVQWSSLE